MNAVLRIGRPGWRTVPIAAISFSLLLLFSSISACHDSPKVEMTATPVQANDSLKPKFIREMVDNKKDPSCGMPLTAGIEDTVHYMGKAYGFCSEECKDQFLKNPAALAKNAEMK